MEKLEKAFSIDLKTGEANEILIQKEVTSQNFVKVFMADFLVALGILNSKSVAVVCYILENVKYSDNTLIATKEQIAKGSGTSVRTVYTVMGQLESNPHLYHTRKNQQCNCHQEKQRGCNQTHYEFWCILRNTVTACAEAVCQYVD